MNDKAIVSTVRGMLKDWEAATPAQREQAARVAAIAACEKELNIRERAALHLTGIPASQNMSAICGLYDTLNHLHIEALESNA